MAKKVKASLEFLLVKAEVKGVPEKGLLRSRNIGQVDLIWLRTGSVGRCLDRINRIDRILGRVGENSWSWLARHHESLHVFRGNRSGCCGL